MLDICYLSYNIRFSRIGNLLTPLTPGARTNKQKKASVNNEWVDLKSRKNNSSFCTFLAICQEMHLLIKCLLNEFKPDKYGFQEKMLDWTCLLMCVKNSRVSEVQGPQKLCILHLSIWMMPWTCCFPDLIFILLAFFFTEFEKKKNTEYGVFQENRFNHVCVYTIYKQERERECVSLSVCVSSIYIEKYIAKR